MYNNFVIIHVFIVFAEFTVYHYSIILRVFKYQFIIIGFSLKCRSASTNKLMNYSHARALIINNTPY